MNNQSNYDKIKAACLKANEKLMELSFGCWFKIVGNIGVRSLGNGVIVSRDIALIDVADHSYRGIGHVEIKTELLHYKPHLFEILGHEPQLSDVLLAIKQADKMGIIDESGKFNNGYYDGVAVAFDLTKSVKQQSPEVLQFLADLL